MKKNHILKLVALSLMVVMTLTVAVTSTYAWLTMSSSPVLEGMRVTIGGDNTIKVAADLTVVTADGTTVHYPGSFSNYLNLSRQEQYGYLAGLTALSPVSTADGVNWFLPSYYTAADEEVQSGNAAVGAIKPVHSFTRDTQLDYANLTEQPADGKTGHYAYFDLWVVSPFESCDLRVATGTDPDDDSGSFLISLPDLQKNTDGGFTLNQSPSKVAASARVGFLVNRDQLTGENGTTALLAALSENSAADAGYGSLRGIYAEKGASTQIGIGESTFTIYEPNADSHPQSALDGSYAATYPVGVDENGNAKEQPVFTRLTIQKQNSWKQDGSGKTLLEGQLEAALYQLRATLGDKAEQLTAEQLSPLFYNEYLQGQYSFLVQKGRFFFRTSDVSTKLNTADRTVSAQQLDRCEQKGATDDATIVRLERNVPQRIRVFIWLEGQDIDCTGAAENLQFAVNLQLAGANG